MFGRVHVASLLETSYLAMTAIDQDNEPIAFIAFDNSPPRSCEMEAEKFHRFLQTCFYLESADFTIQNTLWLSYFTCKDELNLQIMQKCVETLYSNYPFLENVLLLAAPDTTSTLGKIHTLFEPLSRSDEVDNELVHEYDELQDHYVLVARRQAQGTFVRNLNICKARIEDHDDLLPILEAQNEVCIVP